MSFFFKKLQNSPETQVAILRKIQYVYKNFSCCQFENQGSWLATTVALIDTGGGWTIYLQNNID